MERASEQERERDTAGAKNVYSQAAAAAAAIATKYDQ